MKQNWKKIVVGLVVLTGFAATAGPWVYIHWIKDDAPDRLTIADATPASDPPGADSPASQPVAQSENEWSIAEGSQLGYRVVEVLFGQDTEGVGRTGEITGKLTLDGASISSANFIVDMASLVSDDNRRDGKFRGQIMNAAEFPTSTFVLTSPIDLGTVPDNDQEITVSATGDLTLRGATRSVTFDVTAKRTGSSIGVSGSIAVKFADYGIDNPSNGVVTTQDHGLIEFALAFTQG